MGEGAPGPIQRALAGLPPAGRERMLRGLRFIYWRERRGDRMASDEEYREAVLAVLARPGIMAREGYRIEAARTGEEGCREERPCEMCGGPCPALHIHGYTRSRVRDLGSAGDGLPPEFAGLAARIAEWMEAVPTGLCSEACALRWAAGEPTAQEVEGALEMPALFLLAHA